jgi:hypothetical protein
VDPAYYQQGPGQRRRSKIYVIFQLVTKFSSGPALLRSHFLSARRQDLPSGPGAKPGAAIASAE